jgi:hypothetical protein
LRQTNLESASFDDRLQLIVLLDIRIYPSEDLKTVRIRTELGIDSSEAVPGNERDYYGKALFAPP